MTQVSKKYLKELIGRENPLILDIGCYDGRDGIELRDMFEDCELHLFEADPINVQKILDSDYDGILHSVAVGSINGKITFNRSSNHSQSGSIKKPKEHLNIFPEIKFDKYLQVDCIRLDNWYVHYLSPRIIDLIWVDVNGAEKEFINGAIVTLIKKTRFIHIEVMLKQLYENQLLKQQVIRLLPSFEVIGEYNFGENFGNLLMKNKNL